MEDDSLQKSLRQLKEIKKAMEADIRALKAGYMTEPAFRIRRELHRARLAALDEELKSLRKGRYISVKALMISGVYTSREDTAKCCSQ